MPHSACNGNATLGQWQIGILAKYDIENIVDQFDTVEKKKFVKTLSDLPVLINENSVLEKLGIKPTQRISVLSDAPQLYWDLSEDPLNLRISLQFNGGCISRIGVYDPQTKKTFTRYNNLPVLNQPK